MRGIRLCHSDSREMARRGARVYASAVKAAEMEGLSTFSPAPSRAAVAHRVARDGRVDVLVSNVRSSMPCPMAEVARVVAEEGRVDILVNNVGIGMPCPVADAAVAHLVAEEGRVDVLVNNAGIGMPCPVADVPLDQLRQVLDVNLYGAVAMARAVFPVMAQQQTRSRILNMASVAAYVNRPWSCAYSASKAALAAATSCMRMEMRPFSIDVVLVTPGYIKSRIFRNALASAPILPSSSHYKPYEASYREQFAASADNPWATNTADFATQLADVALGKSSPPWRVLYGHQALFAVFMSYLPATILDSLLWVAFAKRK
ncbi:unnamed protein product [Closterium sp. NIES-65]|nr:unnamed protein product [Closterium sp. NIES-65]